jgi:hypothetical protein
MPEVRPLFVNLQRSLPLVLPSFLHVMAIDYTVLTTHAECDKADKEISFELKALTTRDANLDLADDRSDRSQDSTTAQLSKVTGEIKTLDYRLAEPGLDPETQADLSDEREAWVVQRKKLEKRNRQTQGAARLLADVDTEQIAIQVTLLQQVKAGIAARRAELTA